MSLATAFLALVAAAPHALSADPIQFSFVGSGPILHEGTLEIEEATFAIVANGANTYRAAPMTGFDGPGTLLVTTDTRTIEVAVVVSADILARQLGTRFVESWEVILAGDASGRLVLAGADGFARGPSQFEFVIPSGPLHGHYTGASAGNAEILR